MKNVIKEMEVEPETYVWLFYLPILYKKKIDFDNLKSKILDHKLTSVCSFVLAENSSPLTAGCITKEDLKLKQYIPNDFI